jgi:hypothetical protein
MKEKYFEWLGDPFAISIRFPARHFESWWMVEGEPVVGWQEVITATFSSDDVLESNFGFAVNGWHIASHDMRVFLEKHVPRLVQFLPFRLKKVDESCELKGRFVCQLLRLVECLDRTRTKVRDNWEPINEWGDFATLRPLVLDREMVGDQILFRIKGRAIRS